MSNPNKSGTVENFDDAVDFLLALGGGAVFLFLLGHGDSKGSGR